MLNMVDESSPPPPRRRPGNPAMRRGAPSLNPRGRPPGGLTLAAAIRKRWPPERIVQLAEQLLATARPAEALRVLDLLARRGYGGWHAVERQLDAAGRQVAA
jgi:hypothetical protein